MHVHHSGQVDNEADSEEDAFEQIKTFLSYLPNTTNAVAPRVDTGDPPDRRPEELLNIIPSNRRHGYDARELIGLVVDNGEFFEMRRHYAGGIITAFARLDGYSVGVIASDPMKRAGAMDGDVADKYTHFVDLCDAFNLPAARVPGHAWVHVGITFRTHGHDAARRQSADRQCRGRHSQRSSSTCASPTASPPTPPNGMGLPLGLNLRFGWPAGEWGGIPIEGGVAAAYRREIEAAPDPDAHREMIEERLLRLRSPFKAIHAGDAIDLIDPRDTRRLACTFVKLAQPLLAKLAERTRSERCDRRAFILVSGCRVHARRDQLTCARVRARRDSQMMSIRDREADPQEGLTRRQLLQYGGVAAGAAALAACGDSDSGSAPATTAAGATATTAGAMATTAGPPAAIDRDLIIAVPDLWTSLDHLFDRTSQESTALLGGRLFVYGYDGVNPLVTDLEKHPRARAGRGHRDQRRQDGVHHHPEAGGHQPPRQRDDVFRRLVQLWARGRRP